MFLTPLLERPDRRYLLRNERQGSVLARTIEVALDSRSRRRGLLGRDGLPPGSALIIAPCESIHTFFMRFAIDVLFVRRDGTVVRAFERIGPWRIRLAFRAFAAIEFAAGAIAASETRAGDRVALALAGTEGLVGREGHAGHEGREGHEGRVGRASREGRGE